MVQPEPTANIIVSLWPAGEPGKVKLTVISNGSAELDLPETVFVLRRAADTIEQEPQGWQRV